MTERNDMSGVEFQALVERGELERPSGKPEPSADNVTVAIQKALKECPWPEDVWPKTVEEAALTLRRVLGDIQVTAISGALMRHGWQCAEKKIQEILSEHPNANHLPPPISLSPSSLPPQSQGSELYDFAPWKPPFRYDPHGTSILDSENRLMLDIRGLGFLTGKGSEALAMNEEGACVIQDAIGEHVTKFLNLTSVGRGPENHLATPGKLSPALSKEVPVGAPKVREEAGLKEADVSAGNPTKQN